MRWQQSILFKFISYVYRKTHYYRTRFNEDGQIKREQMLDFLEKKPVICLLYNT